MGRSKLVGILFGLGMAILGIVLAGQFLLTSPGRQTSGGVSTGLASTAPGENPASAEERSGFLTGRVATLQGTTYQGRLRWGIDQEASWGDLFHAKKVGNSWASFVDPELLEQTREVEIFGVNLGQRTERINLERTLVVRFGDVTRLDVGVREFQATLKSGRVVALDRFASDDLGDGLRIWDSVQGVVDLNEAWIRTVEFEAMEIDEVSSRIFGTVYTQAGSFKGFIQWNRRQRLGSDELRGREGRDDVSLRFDALESIARETDAGSLVVLRDGREVRLTGSRDVGPGNRGIYVDDPRYGRVSVSWGVFDRLELAGRGPRTSYSDFPAGRPLSGHVTTLDDRSLSGRLVFDLDESESTETLDASFGGVGYVLPFGLVAAVVMPEQRNEDAVARVSLHGGEELKLDLTGDLGPQNAGALVFTSDRESPEYVPWRDVKRIDLDRPPVDTSDA